METDEVVEQTSPLTYQLHTNEGLNWRRHMDQMRCRETGSKRDQIKVPSAGDGSEEVDKESECRRAMRNRKPPYR